MSTARRIAAGPDTFVDLSRPQWHLRGDWPVSWIDHPSRPLDQPSVAAFRLPFSVETETSVRIHVSADNRYRLYIDGEMIGLGPERGEPDHWHYESYELELDPGSHILVAENWWLGDDAPYAQMSVRPGFLLAAEAQWLERLSTGLAPWEVTILPGIRFTSPRSAWGTGSKVSIDGAGYHWGWKTGGGDNWVSAKPTVFGMSEEVKNEIPPYWLLTPSRLPPMRLEAANAGSVRYLVAEADPYPVDPSRHSSDWTPEWNQWLSGSGQVTIPANSTVTAVIDLDNYLCAYPEITVSGGRGSRIRLLWAEALYEHREERERGDKGNRNVIDGKFFQGVGDEFQPDGGTSRVFGTLWWEAGKYLELTVHTEAEPLTLEHVTIVVTGYPLEVEGEFRASDARLEAIIPVAARTLRACMHETYMDCPYYEQLMYVGDTRLQVLATYMMTGDDRLPKKAIETIGRSRRLSGLTQSRYPSRVTQIIPPFSLWWVCMVHDYWLWRDDPKFVLAQMPTVRDTMEHYRGLVNNEGLVGAPKGWNFVDWVPGWKVGIPPDAEHAPSAIINLMLVLSLAKKAEMEEWYGEPMLAERDRLTSREILASVIRWFYDEKRGLLADDLAHSAFSEHVQSLAILIGMLPEDVIPRVVDGLISGFDLAPASIYFSHYLFEAFAAVGRTDLLLARLSVWHSLESLGFKTTFEESEPSRSDCHAWGAHPVYHFHASLLGIRPSSPGAGTILFSPKLGGLGWAEGVLPHPQGTIRARVQAEGSSIDATIVLPGDVTGVFTCGGVNHSLAPGENHICV